MRHYGNCMIMYAIRLSMLIKSYSVCSSTEKSFIYSTLVGLLNAKKYDIGEEVSRAFIISYSEEGRGGLYAPPPPSCLDSEGRVPQVAQGFIQDSCVRGEGFDQSCFETQGVWV